MKNFKFIFISVLLIACTGNVTDSSKTIPTSGQVTLTSEIRNLRIQGFSFSEGKTIYYSGSQNLIPDIVVLVRLNRDGIPIGVYLGSINVKPTYCLKYWSSSMDSSLSYFNNLENISGAVFTELALPITDAQVWAINTHDDKKAKILILNSLAYNDNTNTPYGEVTFKWEYQPDGSNRF